MAKAKFMTGIKYLDEIQYGSHGGGGHHLRLLQGRFGFGLHSRDLFAHYGCVNALEFSRDGEWLVSGGDDKRVLLWNVDRALSSAKQCEPSAMKSEHNSNIFCLGFGGSGSGVVYSGGNDEQVIVHDARTGEARDVFFHDDAVYGLSVDPVADGVFASACDDGRVLVWDSRSRDPFVLAKATSAFHAVAHCPSEPRFLATANARDGICLWDVRRPRTSVLEYGPSGQSAMSVCFNASGTHLLALRRRSPPVLYRSTCTRPVAGFDHPAYYNSCTMKTCCFAGDRDQYVLSGSDDFKLYAWRVPPSDGTWVGRAHYVLRGHRSIVNQVRYNPALGLLASSGVEKIVKLWSPFPLATTPDGAEMSSRRVYSHEEYINLVLEGGQVMNHDYSTQSTAEDQRMMAFFDSLVQRDIEGWTSDSNDGTEFLCPFVQPSESSSSSEDETSQQQQQDTISTLIAHKRREQSRAKRTLAVSGEQPPPPKFLKTSVRSSFRKRLTRVVGMSSSSEEEDQEEPSASVNPPSLPPTGEGRSEEDESGNNPAVPSTSSADSVVSFLGKKRKGKNYRKRNDK